MVNFHRKFQPKKHLKKKKKKFNVKERGLIVSLPSQSERICTHQHVSQFHRAGGPIEAGR